MFFWERDGVMYIGIRASTRNNTFFGASWNWQVLAKGWQSIGTSNAQMQSRHTKSEYNMLRHQGLSHEDYVVPTSLAVTSAAHPTPLFHPTELDKVQAKLSAVICQPEGWPTGPRHIQKTDGIFSVEYEQIDGDSILDVARCMQLLSPFLMLASRSKLCNSLSTNMAAIMSSFTAPSVFLLFPALFMYSRVYYCASILTTLIV
ncbi:hypothetical protein ACRALDRAFT_1091029 [Sodiomyces alcalophilus JCM 7366]|uniref:uncharacterized protein n=1 Tax=Sodiomyces alcalophilus JCM 7366 TaxID=591952 RepID=UPI0039B6D9A3